MNLEVSNFNYGGQAVIEGVMMRGRRYWAVAVRKANKEIIVKDGPVTSVTQKYPILGKPLIRGSVALVEALVFGIKCLTFSANAYAEEETGEELSVKELVFTFGLAIVLTVGFFVVLPAFIIRLIQGAIGSNVLLNLAEGLIKISFFIAYIAGISLMKDIQRVFQYRQASVSPQGAGASGDSAGCGRLVLRSDSAGGETVPPSGVQMDRRARHGAAVPDDQGPRRRTGGGGHHITQSSFGKRRRLQRTRQCHSAANGTGRRCMQGVRGDGNA